MFKNNVIQDCTSEEVVKLVEEHVLNIARHVIKYDMTAACITTVTNFDGNDITLRIEMR